MEWKQERNNLITHFNAMGGKHLVVIGSLRTKAEWVFNEPDIDSARIVWARDMGADKNQRLFEYFSDRRVWRVNVDGSPQGSTSESGR
jgi:hypothetical protein